MVVTRTGATKHMEDKLVALKTKLQDMDEKKIDLHVGRQFWGKLAAQHRGCYASSKMSCKVENNVQVRFTIFYVFWSYFVDLDRIMWIVVIIL